MGSMMLGLSWLLSPILCVVLARKANADWGGKLLNPTPAFFLGVLLGPIGVAIVIIGGIVSKRKMQARAEEARQRAGRPSLDSSGPSLDS
jgi:hypothetical protein